MSIEHVMAVAPVTDIDVAAAWYERLLGRPPDNRPMEGLVEWRLTETGWLEVFHDPDRAGSGLVNFAVDDLDRHVAVLADGLSRGVVEAANKDVQLCAVNDPDGNTITFIGNFRVSY